jgi:hypothetical protein
MRLGDVYLAQRAVPPSEIPEQIARVSIRDRFDDAGLRRGNLWILSDAETVARFHVEPAAGHG